MAEDDEIDILGDFNIDNYLTKNNSGIISSYGNSTELLNCDYTIHPQWLLDRPSANPDCWYDSTLSVAEREAVDALGQISTENTITDESGWTEKEKNLLDRGIEIFGKSHVRLSQFIGSKTAPEVRYYLRNFYSEVQPSYGSFNGVVEEMTSDLSDILDDTQIPASIEEVIAVVSTAKPTVQITTKRSKKKSSSSNDSDYSPNGQSLLKSNNSKLQTTNRKRPAKFKFKTKLKVPFNRFSNFKQKTVKVMNEGNKKPEISKVEITTGKGLAVPICEGEEIVKISKDNSDSDVEIDIGDSDDMILNEKPTINKGEEIGENVDIEKEATKLDNDKVKTCIDLSILDDNSLKELMDLNEPSKELIVNENRISELEKIIHCEFFEGRPTKTPLRYLKIRNHIINCWLNQKPNYVTKTSIRQGLKNCGDVNCISRVHLYLEQIGAINFGCSQTCYIRPLYCVFETILSVNNKDKNGKDSKTVMKQVEGGAARNRPKRKLPSEGEGGCTLTHDEKGQVIHTAVVNEEPTVKPKIVKKPAIRLIYCRPFSYINKQNYRVKMNLSTLLLMDFHAHSSLTEVMGLVAGVWDVLDRTLTISHYEPCRNVASSLTHCDMCPISQAKAADLIHNRQLSILGWFHSHPTFAPEPSQQDLDTQQDIQLWIGDETPCLGVILSPFSAYGALIASPYRCMMVGKRERFEDQFVPYKFEVDLVGDDFDLDVFLIEIKKVLSTNVIGNKESRAEWNKPYFLDTSITHLEKFITSVRMHLAKCGNFNKMTCDVIIENIRRVCQRH